MKLTRRIAATGITSAALAIAGSQALGGTYNFYFNNTEQGNNSTASPALNVTNGAPDKSQPAPLSLPSGTPLADSPSPTPASPEQREPATTTAETPVAAPAEATTTDGTSVAKAALKEPEPRGKPRDWRFTLAGMGVTQKGYYANYRDGALESSSRTWNANVGGTLNLAYFLNRGVGINFYGGAHTFNQGQAGRGLLGAEFEFVPIRLFSVWESEDLIEMGFLAGGSSLRRARGNWASLHGGARLSINIGSKFGITGTLRGNLGYAMAETGLLFRL